MLSYTIRPTQREDVPQIVALINAQSNVPTTVEEYNRADDLRPREYPSLRIVAVTPEGTVVGLGVTSHEDSHDPPGVFGARIRVPAEHQGQGVGAALYRVIEAFAAASGAERIESSVRSSSPAALTWAQRRGYEITSHIFSSTLDLTAWDPSAFAGALERVEAEGMRITTLAAEGETEENLKRFHVFSEALVRDIPGFGQRPDYPYDLWRKRFVEGPHWDSHRIFLAMDGDRWVGVTQLIKLASGELYSDFTGVQPAYRGRGLALALKVAALQAAIEQGGGIVKAENHSTNAPMLAVNERLGFRPGDGVFNLAKRIVP